MTVYTDTISRSVDDLTEDTVILSYLVEDICQKLKSVFRETRKKRSNVSESSRKTITAIATAAEAHLADVTGRISELRHSLSTGNIDPETVVSLTIRKSGIRDSIRQLAGIVAAIRVAPDWQSPSFGASLISEAGTQTGSIVGTVNDYKRDQHLDAGKYESAFLREHVRLPYRPLYNAYTTSSGMAAFTTILGYIQGEIKPATVIVGQGSYFEYQGLLRRIFGTTVQTFDERTPEQYFAGAGSRVPSVVFVDSVTNDGRSVRTDVAGLASAILRNRLPVRALVVDSTLLPVADYRLPVPSLIRNGTTVVFFESLNKYHQFGLDRVTGGIVYGVGKSFGTLFEYREHLGTNIPDASVWALPGPNRRMLTVRLKRFARNTAYLTQALTIPENIRSTIPELCSAYAPYTGRDMPFAGSSIAIRFGDVRHTVSRSRQLLRRIISAARVRGVQIATGTSFGFDTTRIYLTASRTDVHQPFMRISPGTEPLVVMERVSDAITSSLCS